MIKFENESREIRVKELYKLALLYNLDTICLLGLTKEKIPFNKDILENVIKKYF